MNVRFLKIAAVLLLSAPLPVLAQNRTIILLDPAHGGPDAGATVGPSTLEKDVTLAFAGRLKVSLAAAGFSVASTRDSDPAAPLDADLRAGLANHSRASICLILHATPAGSGAHLYTSALNPPEEGLPPNAPVPWETAQAAYIPESVSLANHIGLSLLRKGIPAFVATAHVRPLDNLTCPAVLLEIAPLQVSGAASTSPDNPAYQQHVAEAVTAALSAWRTSLSASAPSRSTPAGAKP